MPIALTCHISLHLTASTAALVFFISASSFLHSCMSSSVTQLQTCGRLKYMKLLKHVLVYNSWQRCANKQSRNLHTTKRGTALVKGLNNSYDTINLWNRLPTNNRGQQWADYSNMSPIIHITDLHNSLCKFAQSAGRSKFFLVRDAFFSDNSLDIYVKSCQQNVEK